MPAQTTLPIEQHRPEDLVFISQKNKLVTDSFLVAKYFGKRHDNVIQKIKSLNCSHEFTNLNFQVCHKNNELQNNKLQPFYQMTKDGFIFLVMGFTGKKAAIIKEAYINAFNLMAEKLTKQSENSIDFNPNLYKDFVDLKEHVNFRVLIDVVAGRASGLQFVPDDAFVCNKEKFMHYMNNSQIFTNQDIIKINAIAAKRLSLM
ncbi:Rha family transcriptional regulator [Vibrio alginolyticus]|uniref:Rha family transcriptional regulator n=1 Tax=Vibrio alginolyticus TaxID=663 RepID=UPI00215E8424|nr:Rha family transcriptional regulator [Vibrio alginolyticus]EIP0122587.1 Rha family transcriptional regulator [Vibrio alginolyticus]ELM4044517.1 Rha family transcriptional regulator [Vibrio parahaemolyticus]MCS0183879.1 Rha family transcriptional regulator [Vibrio alginolyticus]